MQSINGGVFRKGAISIALIFTSLLFIAITSLLTVPEIEEIISSILSEEMLYSLKLSLLTSLTSTLIVMFFSIPSAYALARFSFPGKTFVKSILDLPMAFPELVLGLALLLLFGQTFVGRALETMGLSIVFTKLGIVVAQVFTSFPYAVRVLYSAFKCINPRFELVSRSLGYSEFETFKNITLPLSRNGVFASMIITFARCIGAFGSVLILTGGSFMNTEVLPITLYLNISYGNMGMAVTSGILLVVISFIAILGFEKFEGARL